LRSPLERCLPVLPILFAMSCHATVASAPTPEGARVLTLRGGALRLRAFEWPGTGTPLLMLHGLGGNAASWTPVIPGLAGRHVIAIDLPGHGGSPEGPTWEFGPMARDVVAAVRSRWPGDHIWIGHSWGGRLVVACASADSAGARGVVLVDAVQASPLPITEPVMTVNRLFAGELDPWPSLDSALAQVRKLPQFSPWTPAVQVAFKRAVRVEADGRVFPILTREKGAAVMRTFATDLSREAALIRAPVLVLSAPQSPFESAQRALFPSADFVSLGGNHWLQISNPEGTSRAILAWLQLHRL